jgi:hypothetical protein
VVKLFEQSDRWLNFGSPPTQFFAISNLTQGQNLYEDQSQPDVWSKLSDRGIIINAIF